MERGSGGEVPAHISARTRLPVSFGASKPATDRHFKTSHPGHSPFSTLHSSFELGRRRFKASHPGHSPFFILHSSFELGRLGPLGPLGRPVWDALKHHKVSINSALGRRDA